MWFKQKDGHFSFEKTETGMIVSNKFPEKVKPNLLELGRLNPRRILEELESWAGWAASSWPGQLEAGSLRIEAGKAKK